MTATPYALVCYPDADRPFPPPRSPLEFFGPDKPSDVGPLPLTPPPPSAPRTHPGPTRTYKTNPAFCSQKKRKWEGGDQRGGLPAYATPQKGAAIAEAVPKHNSQTRSGPGGLGGSLPDRCCTGLTPEILFARHFEAASEASGVSLRRSGLGPEEE